MLVPVFVTYSKPEVCSFVRNEMRNAGERNGRGGFYVTLYTSEVH